MAFVNCNPACPTPVIPLLVTDCNAVNNLRDGGENKFLLVDCASVFTDISDSAEWAALVTAGKVDVSPLGIGEIGAPEIINAVVRPNTGEQSTGKGTQTMVFTINELDNVTLSDYDYECALIKAVSNKTLFIVSNAGTLKYDSSWVAGQNGGFSNVSASTTRTGVDSQHEKLVITLKWRYSCMKAILLTPALKTAIGI